MSEIERLTKRCAREKAARKQAEELLEQKSLELYELNKDLAEREEASRSILEATGDGIIIVDESGTIKMLNRAAKLIFGYVNGDMVGYSIEKLLSGDGDSAFHYYLEASEHEPVNTLHETVGVHSDGSKIPLEINVTKADIPEREMVIISVRDIMQRKEAEEEWDKMEIQLRHVQKLESIGQLAAGIAHEINTPIQFVGDNTRFIKEAFSDMEKLIAVRDRVIAEFEQGATPKALITEAKEIADEIDFDYLLDEIPKAINQSLEGIERVGDIVRAMKEFSHPGVEEKTLLDINSAIQSTITVSRNEWKYYSEMKLELDPSLPMVPCLPGDLNQAVLNIVVNAAQAIKDKKEQDADAKGVITVSTCKSGPWAKITIRDTGIGISEETLPHIFDPFFTTKGVGKGTGQGLAITYSAVVDKHGGTIEVESRVGEGSVFTICLPLNC
jgi:PAS domain S-box-containing protein